MTRGDLLQRLSALRQHVDREIGSILSELERPREQPATIDPDPEAPRPFRGRAMQAKYGGKCCVCGQSFEAGTLIVYSDKRSAHVGCGEAETRGR